MRSAALALATSVAVLTNATVAHAGTTAVAGYCEWSPEPDLFELTELVGDADCASAQAITIAPNVETTTRMTPVFDGPREFGKPSAVQAETTVTIVADPLTDRSARLSFFWDQYASFRDAVHSYNEAVDRIAEPIGEIHATYMSVVVLRGAPEWVKNADAAAARTLVNVAGGALALGPNLVLFPEAVLTAPDRIFAGSSKIHRGISEGHFDYAAKGIAEVCGGVGVLASLAAPIAGGLKGRPPISIAPTARATTASTAIASEAAAVPSSPAVVGKAQPLRGSGPVPGVIEVSDRFASTKAFQNYNPSTNPLYAGERTTEFIYDPTTKRFAVGKTRVPSGSPHESLARAVGADESKVVGGTFSRGPNGEILTNEYSGHYWKNWSPETRGEFIEFLESRTGQKVEHTQ